MTDGLMGFLARAGRFMVLLQIALFTVSAVMMTGSLTVAREISGSAAVVRDINGGTLDPNRPVCVNGPCGPGEPYIPRPRPCRTIYGCRDQPPSP